MLPRTATKKINLLTFFSQFSEHTNIQYQQNSDATDYCYREEHENNSIGTCRIRGYRDSQEDELANSSASASAFKNLPEDSKTKVLTEVFKSLQDSHGHHAEMGSTACATFAWLEHNKICVWNANLGNSGAFLVIINEAEGMHAIEKLTKPHQPDPTSNLEEFKRIRKFGVPVQIKNIWFLKCNSKTRPWLSVTRAIGDTNLEIKGLLHTPEIKHATYAIEPTYKVFLVTTSDGFLEVEKVAEQLGQIIFNHLHKPVEQLAALLVANAFEHKACDNLAISVTQLTEQPIACAVFDGHRGNQVAIALGAMFFPTVKNYIDKFYPTINLNKDIYTHLFQQSWSSVITLLARLEPTEFNKLNATIREKINLHRPELTTAFIELVKQVDDIEKTVMLRDVLEQKNMLGVILNMPVNTILFTFSQFLETKKVTGSISKIQETFAKLLEAPTTTELVTLTKAQR